MAIVISLFWWWFQRSDENFILGFIVSVLVIDSIINLHRRRKRYGLFQLCFWTFLFIQFVTFGDHLLAAAAATIVLTTIYDGAGTKCKQ